MHGTVPSGVRTILWSVNGSCKEVSVSEVKQGAWDKGEYSHMSSLKRTVLVMNVWQTGGSPRKGDGTTHTHTHTHTRHASLTVFVTMFLHFSEKCKMVQEHVCVCVCVCVCARECV